MTTKRLVALYVRVSSTRQVEEGYSLEAQEKVLRDEVLKQNNLVFKVYKDAGISGANTNRPGLMELLNDAKLGLFSSVGVWNISRISRNLTHFLWIVDELNKSNVTIFSINENFDLSTSIGKFTAQMLAGVAQMQRDSWKENSILGSKLRAKNGKYAGGQLLGYRSVPDADDPRGGNKLVIDQNEASTVRKIYDLYCQGFGLKAIVQKVNNEGLHGKNGSPFSLMTVRDILTNKAYIGYVKYNGIYYAGIHEPIISTDQWNRVQEILKSRYHKEKVVDYKYLLPGLIKCPVCGSGMIPWHTYQKNKNGTTRAYYYYICGTYMNKGSNCCKPNAVKAMEADTVVLNFISRYLCDEAWRNKVLIAIKEKYASDDSSLNKIEEAKAKISKLSSRKTDLLLKYEEGTIDKDELVCRTAELQKEYDSAMVFLQILKANSINKSLDEKAVMDALNNIPEVLSTATVEDKVLLLKRTIKGIYVNSNRVVCSIEVYLPSRINMGEEITMTFKV